MKIENRPDTGSNSPIVDESPDIRVFRLWAASLFFQLFAIACSTFLPLYFKTLGLTEGDVAGIDGQAFSLSVVGIILSGFMLGRNSYSKVVGISFLVSGIAASLVALLPDLEIKFGFLLLCFIGMAVSSTLLPLSAVVLLPKASFGAEYGRYRRVGSYGFLAGLLCAGLMADLLGAWSYPVLTGLGFILSAFFFSRVEFPDDAPALNERLHISFPRNINIWRSLRAGLLRYLDLFIFGFSQLIIWATFSACFRYLPLRMKQMGSTSLVISITLSLLGIVAIISIARLGRVTDRIDSRRLWPIVPISLAIRAALIGLPDTQLLWFIPMQLLHIPTWVLNDILVLRFLRDKRAELGALRISMLSQFGMIFGLSLGSFLMSLAIPVWGLQNSFFFISLIPLLFLPIFLMRWTSGSVTNNCVQ